MLSLLFKTLIEEIKESFLGYQCFVFLLIMLLGLNVQFVAGDNVNFGPLYPILGHLRSGY